jgi:hypothetical protein
MTAFFSYYENLARKYPLDDLKYLLAFLIVFYLTLLALRINGVLKKESCPKCGGKINRVQKTIGDRIYAAATLGILPLRRYKCEVCNWKGIRWNTEKSFYVKKRKRRSKKVNTDYPSNSSATT